MVTFPFITVTFQHCVRVFLKSNLSTWSYDHSITATINQVHTNISINVVRMIIRRSVLIGFFASKRFIKKQKRCGFVERRTQDAAWGLDGHLRRVQGSRKCCRVNCPLRSNITSYRTTHKCRLREFWSTRIWMIIGVVGFKKRTNQDGPNAHQSWLSPVGRSSCDVHQHVHPFSLALSR